MRQKYIYVISDGLDLKIGVAYDPPKRLKTLQTGNKNKLILEYSEPREQAFKTEKYLHNRFAKHHVGGEWYSGITLRDVRIELLLCLDID